MFKKVAILLFFSAFGLCLNGADFNVTKGWNLLGTDNNISNLGIFKFQGIKYIWAFDNITKKWKVYVPEYNGSLPFDKLENINAKSGFWVYSDKNDSIKIKHIYRNCTQFFNSAKDINKSDIIVMIDGYLTEVKCEKNRDGNITALYNLTKDFGFEFNGKTIKAKHKIYENNVTNFQFLCPTDQTPQFMDENVWWQGGWCSGEDRKNRVMCRDSLVFDDCYCCDKNTSIYGHTETIIYDYAKLKITE